MAETRKPKMSWWRAHASARHDPKVQRLPGETFKAWFNLLCLACEHDGILPPIEDIAYELRKSEDATQRLLIEMEARDLFHQTEAGWEPHNWNGRQYRSDVSTERVKQFRERRRNVSETPSDTETEADTEKTVAKATEPRRRSDPDEQRFKLPSDWKPSPDCGDYARDKGLDPAVGAEAFTDYFTQGRGRNEKRSGPGWEKRWRVWCNTDADRNPRRVPGVRSTAAGGDAGAFARAAHRLGNG